MGKGRKARRAYILNAVLLQFRVDLGPSGSSHWLRPGRLPRFQTDRCVGGCGHGTPDTGVNLWGASPLDENGCLKEGSIPNVTPIDKVLGEGNCGRVTDRGEEAGAQSCEATYRNAIEAERDPEVSCPWTAKPFPTDPEGRWRACAAKVHALIRGGL